MTQSKSRPINPKKNKTSWLKFFYAGVNNEVFSEDIRRVFIINFFSTVGILFTLPLGVLSLYKDDIILGSALIFIAFLYAINHVYLRNTHNYSRSGNFVIYPLYALMIYLVYAGGSNGTGHVWIFCVPAVSLFLHGMKRGLIELCVFTFALIYVMFFMDNHFSDFGYHNALKSRILFSFLVVVFLSGIYEYSMSRFNHELKETSTKLKLVAYIDALTGLLNRRGMLKRLEEKASGTSFHLLLADVDFFKRVNDEFGHDAGDYALTELAGIIQTSLPSDGFASRWGGEEFLIAVSDCSESDIYSLAEDIRMRIESHEFAYQDHTFRMTLSIGLAVTNEFIPLSQAVTTADNCLYSAKRSGRNQTRKS